MGNESMEKVVTQDVSTTEAKPDVKPAVDSSTSAPANTQPNGAANTDAGQVVPYGKDPGITKFVDRQVAKREQVFKDELKKLKDEFAAERAAAGKPADKQLAPEEEEAVLQLAQHIFGNSKVREKYGLDKIDKFEKVQQQTQSEAEHQMFESEMETVLSDAATKYGYDKTELRDDIEDFIANDPWFADKSFHKGSLQKAAKLFFSDKSQELADRASNLKLIKEQKEKKAAGTESTSTGKKGQTNVKDKTLNSFLDRRVEEEGGMKFD